MADGDFEKKKGALFSGSIGTVYRLIEAWTAIDDYTRVKDFMSVLHEESIVKRNVLPFTFDIDKKTGALIHSPEYNSIIALENKCLEEVQKCGSAGKEGGSVFKPSMEFIKALDAYDEFLRAIALKYGLYMLQNEDESDVSPLARMPKMNIRHF